MSISADSIPGAEKSKAFSPPVSAARTPPLGADRSRYNARMEDDDGLETFTERFVRLTRDMSRKEIGQVLDLTESAVKKLVEGQTQSLKAHGAIALARRLGVSVEYLADRGPLPAMPSRPSEPRRGDESALDRERDRVRLATREDLAALRSELLDALRPIQAAFEAQADLLEAAERLATPPPSASPTQPDSGPSRTNAHRSSSGRRAK